MNQEQKMDSEILWILEIVVEICGLMNMNVLQKD